MSDQTQRTGLDRIDTRKVATSLPSWMIAAKAFGHPKWLYPSGEPVVVLVVQVDPQSKKPIAQIFTREGYTTFGFAQIWLAQEDPSSVKTLHWAIESNGSLSVNPVSYCERRTVEYVGGRSSASWRLSQADAL